MEKKLAEKNRREKKAFTLIEVITVLLVVSLGMVGVLSLIVQNIQSQILNKDTLIAYQLAQEGMELVRQVRDTNWRNSLDWRTNLAAGTYRMDYLDSIPNTALGRTDGDLSQDENGMYYSNPGGLLGNKGFSRLIYLEERADEGLLVTINIYWSDHGRDYVYSLESLLYDWR
jgi:prepilin-type N-terminal cleavage/methylation domain-containing protein